MGDTNPANLMGLAPHDPLSSTIGNYQNDVLQCEAELGHAGYVVGEKRDYPEPILQIRYLN